MGASPEYWEARSKLVCQVGDLGAATWTRSRFWALVSLVLGVADVVFLVFELHWVRDLWHHLSTSRGVIA